jgi:gamma-glutamyl hercynylcysteine S-oxide synthase
MKPTSPRITSSYLLLGNIVVLLLFGAAIFTFGLWLNKANIIIGAAAIAMVFLLMRLATYRWKFGREIINPTSSISPEREESRSRGVRASGSYPARKPIDPNNIDALVEQMLAQGRFVLLLRPQIARKLGNAHFSRSLRALEKSMALVPDGEVQLEKGELSRIVTVQRFFLDRYPVTNREFYEFVAAGGYQQPPLWDEKVLPAVLDFIDRTGNPGPKYWQNGCYPEGEEKHPVSGVNWYEASAYARWIGKRLPSDAEWIKAGSWPVRISTTSNVQRKYPWGDSMDRSRANLWGSGPGRTVPVDHYPEGVSVGGVHQLIGNVWEWTASNFSAAALPSEDLPRLQSEMTTSLRSIRGGAFDTYFDNQASCQFQSGENPMSRRYNIGFRCAIGVCDLVLVRPVKEGYKKSDPAVCTT